MKKYDTERGRNEELRMDWQIADTKANTCQRLAWAANREGRYAEAQYLFAKSKRHRAVARRLKSQIQNVVANSLWGEMLNCWDLIADHMDWADAVGESGDRERNGILVLSGRV